MSDLDLLPQVTASVLRMPPPLGRSMLDTLIDGLEPQKLLLTFDKCEHVIESAASLINSIMRACPGVKVLATAREALGVPGEVAFRVPSLTVPTEPKHAAGPALPDEGGSGQFHRPPLLARTRPPLP